MLVTLLLIPFAFSCASAFSLPFKIVPAPVTNITQGGETLVQSHHVFVANLTIGTPGQQFSVVVDTRSSDLIIPDSTCASSGVNATCVGKRLFQSSASSTYQASQGTYEVRDELGHFAGFAGNDVIVLGDRPTDLITIPNLKFLQATTIGHRLHDLNADGILGLAFSSRSQIQGKAPFIQAVEQGDVSDSVFSIWLEHANQTDDLGTHGVIYYGGYDPIHCEPNPQFLPLSAAGFYQATAVSVDSQGTSLQSYTRPAQTTFVSTEDTIGLPNQLLSIVLKSVGLDYNQIHQYPPTVDCATNITLTFTFPGINNGPRITANVTQRNLVENERGTCRLLVVPNNQGIHLGTPFFRGKCVYFDVVRQQIGYVPARLQV